MKADATTWLSKDENGVLRAVKVVDMEDSHVCRWIRYFRKKYRSEFMPTGDDARIDMLIQRSIVTAPAIYAEAQRRGLLSVVAEVATTTSEPKTTGPAGLGVRRINLNDE